MRQNTDLQSQLSVLTEDASRSTSERSALGAALDRMQRQMMDSHAAVVEEGRRALEEANAASR